MMSTDRTVRTLIAAILVIAALFLGMNYLIDSRPIVDWWLPLLLLIAGLLLTQADRLRREEEIAAPAEGPVIYSVREYSFPEQMTAPALTGPEQSGEVNVDEPRDEVESEPVIEAPETMTPPAEPVEEEAPEEPHVIPAPETETPPPAPPTEAEVEPESADTRAVDDFETGGEFAPPSSMEGVLNPPTESDTMAGVVVKHETPIQEKDPAAHETPLTRITEPEKPAESQAERLEKQGDILQPSETAENEFQVGEHVAANQPTRSAPPATQTTGEGMGSGHETMRPEEKAVLDTTSAPSQPKDKQAVDPTHPEVADTVLSGSETAETSEGLAASESIQPSPASQNVTGGSGLDDLTVVVGIGPRMQQALNAAGITTYSQLAAASEEQLRAAIEAAGMRLAPTLSTWGQQAGFLARGDRAGFESMLNALRGREDLSEE